MGGTELSYEDWLITANPLIEMMQQEVAGIERDITSIQLNKGGAMAPTLKNDREFLSAAQRMTMRCPG